jgi:hypothetical protein
MMVERLFSSSTFLRNGMKHLRASCKQAHNRTQPRALALSRQLLVIYCQLIAGVRASPRRVRRVMRANGLLALHRVGRTEAGPHDGTIITGKVNALEVTLKRDRNMYRVTAMRELTSLSTDLNLAQAGEPMKAGGGN